MDDALRCLVEVLEGYDPSSLPIVPSRFSRDDIARRFDFERPRPLSELVTEVAALLRVGVCHASHPRHFGLFTPTTTLAAVIAEALVARFNPQLAVTATAPFPIAAERHVLATLATLLGLDPSTLAMNFTSGGAESNHSAVLCALTHRVAGWIEQGAPCEGRPVLYASEDAHGSLQKAVQATGLGRNGWRGVPVDHAGRMDLVMLRRRLAEDRAAGYRPVMLAATVGTTSTGAIDPLRALATVAREEGLWFHVDAAWGGLAAFSPRRAHLLDGITEADSITWDAHKSLPVPLGAGMFFCRHPNVLRAAFGVGAPYTMRAGGTDPFLTTMQWSRRFAGLGTFLTLASRGLTGMAHVVDRQFELGAQLREGLVRAGFTVLNDTPLPVVCFTHPRIQNGALSARKVARALWQRGEAWVSVARARGQLSLRACVSNVDSRAVDVDALLRAVTAVVTAPCESPRNR